MNIVMFQGCLQQTGSPLRLEIPIGDSICVLDSRGNPRVPVDTFLNLTLNYHHISFQ